MPWKSGKLLKGLFNIGVLTADAGDGFAAVTGGSAAAAGDDTLAVGAVSNNLVDTPKLTVAKGGADFAAAATGEGAVAAADTYAGVSGADLVITWNGNTVGNGETAAAAESQVKFLAIDFNAFDFAFGQFEIELGFGRKGGTTAAQIDGNLAGVDATATATGSDNTLGVTTTSALAVEDAFSAVSGSAFTAIA